MEVSKLLLSMFMLVSFSFINAGDRCHDKEWLKDPANITEEQWKEIYARDCARRSDKRWRGLDQSKKDDYMKEWDNLSEEQKIAFKNIKRNLVMLRKFYPGLQQSPNYSIKSI